MAIMFLALAVVLFVGASADTIDVFIDSKYTEPQSGIEFGPFHVRKETGVRAYGGPKQELKNCGGKEMAFTYGWTPKGTLEIGKNYTFHAETTAAHDMVYGIALPILYFNDILIINTKLYFCDYIPREYKICPLKKGDKVSFEIGATITSGQVQSGHYHGNCTISNEKNEEMLCVTADVTFT